jgi:hypothetical protein
MRLEASAQAMKPWIPNPSLPAGRKPVELITDRAKRYRANRNAPPGERRCAYCGAPRPRDIDHVDGDESNNNPENLVYACRSCNVRKGQVFARAGLGVRTRQFNPHGKGATSLGQWVQAVLALRGEASTMSLPAAVRLVKETPASRRSAFAAEIWRRRRERGTDKLVPF